MRHLQALSTSIPTVVAVAVLSCLAAGAAQATNPAVILTWTHKNGGAITPTDTIIAAEGDELTLQVSLDPGSAGLHEFGFSVQFDEPGLKELDLGTYTDPVSGGGWEYIEDNWNLMTTTFNSIRDPGDDEAFGQVGSYQACTQVDQFGICEEGPAALTAPIIIGTIDFEVTEYVATNGADLVSGRYLLTSEFFVVDYQGAIPVELCPGTPDDECTEIDFGTATVPEPATAALQAVALSAIAGVARVRRRTSAARG